ncbi:hypothetical protein SAMD00019534_005860 [Acytostelium subglobosum LB1]|uniref:hypothetical protein n=1 Tax=Acytostelium subglobosum LB1 TaxID=1410327 RepID=UPI000644E97D|nr:hypothetical protein SAMD00019534_005860 [Acytostelium subglobosum LB1]GAM17412.1 hypothetical protein SAMD00019534_005860 [Acytostelium subglobosum LB1]|eukprot:XP_012759474.1 hypothetical protein SAMD00019534_005860 [Acytostelium subglobosum LB1]
MINTEADICFNWGCSGGACVKVSSKTCPPVKCQNIDGCDGTLGCHYKPKCVAPDACTTNTCNDNGDCVSAPVICPQTDKWCTDYSCDKTLGCVSTAKSCAPADPAPCTIYSCVPGVGCVSKLSNSTECTCCDPKSTPMCMVASCDAQSGKCVYTNVTVDDNNPCTVDACNPVTGAITHTPKQCKGCQTCDPTNPLGCKDTDSVCSNGNACSVGHCNDGQCSFTMRSCDDGNPCTKDTCDAALGCQHPDMVCPDLDLCTVGTCVKGVGCSYTNATCSSEQYCTESLCDKRLGCLKFPRQCVPKNPQCQIGVCDVNLQACKFTDILPIPDICKTPATTSTTTSTTTTTTTTTTGGHTSNQGTTTGGTTTSSSATGRSSHNVLIMLLLIGLVCALSL